jgi:hypothetical protein
VEQQQRPRWQHYREAPTQRPGGRGIGQFALRRRWLRINL